MACPTGLVDCHLLSLVVINRHYVVIKLFEEFDRLMFMIKLLNCYIVNNLLAI